MRLIDADALKSKMDGYWGRCQRIRKPRNGETAVFLDIKAAVEAQPTVEAIPVDFIRSEIKRMKEGSNRYYSECEAYADDLDILLAEWERRQ